MARCLRKLLQLYLVLEDRSVTKNVCLLTMLLLVALAAGCSAHNTAATDQKRRNGIGQSSACSRQFGDHHLCGREWNQDRNQNFPK